MRRSALGRSLGLILVVFFLSPIAFAQTALLDRLDDSLYLQSHGGWFRSDLSVLLDLEGYYIDQRPPGLLFGDDEDFFNPRLSLYLDTRLGPHFYSLVQARFDRGFDPRATVRDARADEYLLRYTPLDTPAINLQVGKFATVVGNWVPRHDSWNNPFITAPVPYENVVIITDAKVAPGPGPFLARRTKPDDKFAWLPVIWGPSYAAGASVFGRLEKLDYALEVKNASLSSRPAVWDPTELGWENPTVSGRLGVRPTAAWNAGASFSVGPYLLPAARKGIAAGAAVDPHEAVKDIDDFNQIPLGGDVSYAWRHWQFWAEVFASRFEVPFVGDADTLAYYLEAKYKITSGLFAALRWNQQFFGDVPDGRGGKTWWDRDLWRIDTALGYRFNRHLQSKLQYSLSHQRGDLQQGEQLVAAQVTVKF